jgi:hypothetical protein
MGLGRGQRAWMGDTRMEAIATSVVGSFVAISAILALAFALGFRGKGLLADEGEVRALAQPFGGTHDYMLDAHGTGAFALLIDGRLFAAKVMGNQIVTRVFPRTAILSVKVRQQNSSESVRVVAKFNDFSFPTLQVETTKQSLPTWLEAFLDDGKLE